jgi:hypothetical protein
LATPGLTPARTLHPAAGPAMLSAAKTTTLTIGYPRIGPKREM